jgi:L-iditol 2-dehydrogenase
MTVPARNCFKVPASVSDDAAALLEPLGVALHSLDLGKLRPDDSVVIFGAGPVGLLLLSLVRIAGAKAVYVFEPVAARRAHAAAIGATAVWDVARDALAHEVIQPLMDATAGRGVDVGFEVADAGRSVDQTFAATRIGGRVVLVGIPAYDRTEFGHSVPRRKGLTVRFSRRMKHTYPRAIALQSDPLMAGVLDGLVSHRFGLTDSKAAYDLAESCRDGVIKAVIEPGRQ